MKHGIKDYSDCSLDSFEEVLLKGAIRKEKPTEGAGFYFKFCDVELTIVFGIDNVAKF